MSVQVDSNSMSYLAALRRTMRVAVSTRLNKAVSEGWAAMRREIETKVDRPTPFTMIAVRYRKSTLASRTASVELNPKQSDYLAPMIEGSAYSGPLRGMLKPVPFTAAQDKYGNLPKGITRKARSRRISRQPTGKRFIRMKGRGLVAVWSRRNKFTKQLEFYGTVRRAAQSVLYR